MLRLLRTYFPALLASLLLFAAAGILWARPVNLMNSDLGRHIQNGRIILQHWHVPETNFYSYTHPDFPVINHHWGTGVLFYVLYTLGNVTAVITSMLALELFALALLFTLAWKRYGFLVTLPATIFALPLITSRTEIRPEIFSSFFIALFLFILVTCTNERWRNGLFALPILLFLWVNLHVYFFLGIAITGCYFLDEALAVYRRQGSPIVLRALGQSIVLQLFATLLNPAGIPGALVPLTLFGNFGYMLAENQSVWFLGSRGLLPILWPFILFVAAILVVWLAVTWMAVRRGERFPLASFLLTAAFTGMAVLALRNWSLLGLVAILTLSEGMRRLWQPSLSPLLSQAAALVLGCAVAIGLYFLAPMYWIGAFSTPSVYVRRGNTGVIQFFLQEKLVGPIFNNYDVGGGLIFGLYPQENVFVDNRPEAYPVAFFKEVYIPMQEDAAVWKTQDEKWKFNAILFNRNDLTPWSQSFLIRAVQDPAWAPVYVDDDTILLLKRNEKNAAVIRRFEIPKHRFRLSEG